MQDTEPSTPAAGMGQLKQRLQAGHFVVTAEIGRFAPVPTQDFAWSPNPDWVNCFTSPASPPGLFWITLAARSSSAFFCWPQRRCKSVANGCDS